MEKACRMKLNKLHILYRHPCTPCNGKSITRCNIRITGVKINLAAATTGKNDKRRSNRHDFARKPFLNIGATTPVIPRKSQPAGSDKIYDHTMLKYSYILFRMNSRKKRFLDFSTSNISRMENPSFGMATLLPEIVPTSDLFRKGQAKLLQF